MPLTRRKLLAIAAGSTLLRRRAFGDPTPGLIVNSARPKDYEMTLAGFKEWITPAADFYVRNHHYTPDVNLADWNLRVDGVVNSPVTLTMNDLRQFPAVSHIAVLECAGNGRSFYEPHLPGMQWKQGGVANGKWTGARLRDVLQRAGGVRDSAKHVLFSGEDVPIGKQPKFQRTVEIAKALDPDTILAYQLNGEAIPLEHGMQLRLVVPGWAGDSWVKWVRHVEVLDHEFDGFWMKTAYRHPTHPVAPGTSVPPDQMVPVTDLPVKSVIATPAGGWARPGRVKISGAAWSNGSPVTKVDVSTDNGASWRAATLGSDQSKYAWRLWELDWKAPAGEYKLMARATDAAGRVQPMVEDWNPSGYLWNVAAPRPVIISRLAPAAAASATPSSAAHPHGFQQACLTCHEEDIIRMQKLTAAQWEREVQKMTGWGADIKPEDREAVLDYLSANFKQ
jgi:DMSO/TMAO reductase YedYZ molybdopterin-dependent catalytic subunit